MAKAYLHDIPINTFIKYYLNLENDPDAISANARYQPNFENAKTKTFYQFIFEYSFIDKTTNKLITKNLYLKSVDFLDICTETITDIRKSLPLIFNINNAKLVHPALTDETLKNINYYPGTDIERSNISKIKYINDLSKSKSKIFVYSEKIENLFSEPKQVYYNNLNDPITTMFYHKGFYKYYAVFGDQYFYQLMLNNNIELNKSTLNDFYMDYTNSDDDKINFQLSSFINIKSSEDNETPRYEIQYEKNENKLFYDKKNKMNYYSIVRSSNKDIEAGRIYLLPELKILKINTTNNIGYYIENNKWVIDGHHTTYAANNANPPYVDPLTEYWMLDSNNIIFEGAPLKAKDIEYSFTDMYTNTEKYFTLDTLPLSPIMKYHNYMHSIKYQKDAQSNNEIDDTIFNTTNNLEFVEKSNQIGKSDFYLGFKYKDTLKVIPKAASIIEENNNTFVDRIISYNSKTSNTESKKKFNEILEAISSEKQRNFIEYDPDEIKKYFNIGNAVAKTRSLKVAMPKSFQFQNFQKSNSYTKNLTSGLISTNYTKMHNQLPKIDTALINIDKDKLKESIKISKIEHIDPIETNNNNYDTIKIKIPDQIGKTPAIKIDDLSDTTINPNNALELSKKAEAVYFINTFLQKQEIQIINSKNIVNINYYNDVYNILKFKILENPENLKSTTFSYNLQSNDITTIKNLFNNNFKYIKLKSKIYLLISIDNFLFALEKPADFGLNITFLPIMVFLYKYTDYIIEQFNLISTFKLDYKFSDSNGNEILYNRVTEISKIKNFQEMHDKIKTEYIDAYVGSDNNKALFEVNFPILKKFFKLIYIFKNIYLHNENQKNMITIFKDSLLTLSNHIIKSDKSYISTRFNLTKPEMTSYLNSMNIHLMNLLMNQDNLINNGDNCYNYYTKQKFFGFIDYRYTNIIYNNQYNNLIINNENNELPTINTPYLTEAEIDAIEYKIENENPIKKILNYKVFNTDNDEIKNYIHQLVIDKSSKNNLYKKNIFLNSPTNTDNDSKKYKLKRKSYDNILNLSYDLYTEYLYCDIKNNSSISENIGKNNSFFKKSIPLYINNIKYIYNNNKNINNNIYNNKVNIKYIFDHTDQDKDIFLRALENRLAQ